MRLAIASLFAVWLSSLSAGCASAGFVAQGAYGQFSLWRHARPLSEALADPETPAATKQLLAEVQEVKRHAKRQGLDLDGNYEQYVALEKPYVVWAVNASKPLAFEPKIFDFPIVGSFPSVSWFDEQVAIDHGKELERQGWDVHVRGVGAYSTGGWFDDPILSSMIAEGPNALAYLANVVIHESVHATVLIKDQQFFNESIASFIADRMAEQYLEERQGPNSAVLATYRDRKVRGKQVTDILIGYNQKLEAVYQGPLSTERKLQEKARIMAEVQRRLGMAAPPNNATMIGYRLYRVANDEFQTLYDACRRDWPCFIRATKSLESRAFGAEQRADFGPVVLALRDRILAARSQRELASSKRPAR